MFFFFFIWLGCIIVWVGEVGCFLWCFVFFVLFVGGFCDIFFLWWLEYGVGEFFVLFCFVFLFIFFFILMMVMMMISSKRLVVCYFFFWDVGFFFCCFFFVFGVFRGVFVFIWIIVRDGCYWFFLGWIVEVDNEDFEGLEIRRWWVVFSLSEEVYRERVFFLYVFNYEERCICCCFLLVVLWLF